MAMQMDLMKEQHSEQRMENDSEHLKDYDLGHLMEIQWELPKEMSLAYLLAELMAMQMALLTECCWVQPMEKGLEQLMEIWMVLSSACLLAVLRVMQTASLMESD